MKAIATIRSSLLWLPILVGTLAGCASAPPQHRQAAPAPESAAMLSKAQSAAESGDYAIAAREYKELAANSSGATRYEYLLSAAEAFLHGNFIEQAKLTMGSVPTEALDPRSLNRRQAIEADIALAEHQPRLALDALKKKIESGS